VKRRRKTINFGKQVERAGLSFSLAPSTLPAWMQDPKLLPKAPPKPRQPKGA
jgi:hypothetical protein